MPPLEAFTLTRADLVGGAAAFVLSLVVTTALAIVVLVRLPATHFVDDPAAPARGGFARRLGRNALGVALVVVGALLSVPGVPGQGALTVLIGLTLLDFPGKRRLERVLFRSARLRATLDRVRARFGKEPFVVPP
jgi:hypothetical protein